MESRERRVTAQDGLSLYLRDYGDPLSPRAPVLCLGGLTRNARDFEDLAPHLASHRRVVCPDYRGRGRSDYAPDWRPYTPVIGTSMGGLLAMALAVARPGALRAVVLNDIGPEIDPAGLARIKTYVGGDERPADWDRAVIFVKQQFIHDGLTSDDQWLNFAKRIYTEDQDGAIRLDYDPAISKPLGAAATADYWPAFNALRQFPLLAIRGALSDILSLETFARMAREPPDLTAVTLAGIGHVPLLDEPQSVSAIDDFLAALYSADLLRYPISGPAP